MPSDRADWPFPALMPYRTYHYPVPAMLPRIDPPRGDRWLWPMTDGAAKYGARTPGHNKKTHIYIHVPFCPFKCSFCPFYKEIGREHSGVYVDALVREIRLYGQLPEATRQPYDTIYFGGGTPTELTPDQFGMILGALRENLDLAADAEITVEGVAEEMLREKYLERLRELGVTRIAFGVQSLDPEVRRTIGRGPESVEAYPNLVELANRIGVYANVELMLGCPGQSEEILLRDFAEVMSWEPASVDVASYQMVPGTSLFRTIVRRERAEPASGARLLAMRELATETFRAAGYRPGSCEVFLRDDTHSYSPSSPEMVENGLNAYLAFGPSGIGHLEGTSYSNLPDLTDYVAAVEQDRLPIARRQRLGFKASARRAILGGLGGLHVPSSFLVTGRQRAVFSRWREQGLVTEDGDGYLLTDRGVHWGNQMQVAFLTYRDLMKLAPMLGSVNDQNALFAGGSEVGGELLRQIADGSAVRRHGYRTAIRVLSHVPGVDKRGTSLIGTKEPDAASSRRTV